MKDDFSIAFNLVSERPTVFFDDFARGKMIVVTSQESGSKWACIRYSDGSLLTRHSLILNDLVGPSKTQNSGIISESADMKLERLGDLRRSTLLLHLTHRLLYTKWRDPGEEPKLDLFGQLKRIAKQWLDTCLVCQGPDICPALVILDSDWEAEFCRVAESHPKVRAYAKNHSLGFEVPYHYGPELRKYRPDFIVLVDNGHTVNANGTPHLPQLAIEI